MVKPRYTHYVDGKAVTKEEARELAQDLISIRHPAYKQRMTPGNDVEEVKGQLEPEFEEFEEEAALGDFDFSRPVKTPLANSIELIDLTQPVVMPLASHRTVINKYQAGEDHDNVEKPTTRGGPLIGDLAGWDRKAPKVLNAFPKMPRNAQVPVYGMQRGGRRGKG